MNEPKSTAVDNGIKTTAAPGPRETGFPVLLIVQILLAVLNFLIQRVSEPGDMRRLIQLRELLEAPLFGKPETK